MILPQVKQGTGPLLKWEEQPTRCIKKKKDSKALTGPEIPGGARSAWHELSGSLGHGNGLQWWRWGPASSTQFPSLHLSWSRTHKFQGHQTSPWHVGLGEHRKHRLCTGDSPTKGPRRKSQAEDKPCKTWPYLLILQLYRTWVNKALVGVFGISHQSKCHIDWQTIGLHTPSGPQCNFSKLSRGVYLILQWVRNFHVR